ncbi:Arginine--tRNA ligase [Tepidanaerobacter acetatoxydans Re1]|uniref:Arginine--tRNA ligase n=1 Tax=Tepidanaerobacter acetatoxydans (strain DSM 21804 / JCM 16047 / Re1) TaxID=1209989 RepID=F4LTW3_TEPAE|nr:arginine--tRNA ligase [Tepidanaerobacter acetatoxydans]AEE92560.1 Arginyl-tRNA synthetase [Tepidanaerobacter acetatoxydans Re1]CCP27512.1 Arginine--tRNA ligase [Tepidanaerobacter acetatoxydans Re1]
MKDLKTQVQQKLMDIVMSALNKAIDDGALPIKDIPDFHIEVPQDKGHGDFATNIAMILAREAKMPPRKIGEVIAERVDTTHSNLIEKIEVAGPGFINFYLVPTWVNAVISDILKYGSDFGRCNTGEGKKVQVEFVSANPTGPMHMGNARGAALGDALASILEMVGFDVTKEFYINDAGNQIENFGLSLEARYLELMGKQGEIPEGGYHGEDIIEHMKDLIEQEGDRFLYMDSPTRRAYFINYALEKNIERMKKDLENFGVHFDVWFSEQSLHSSGKVNEVIKILTDRGYTYEKDGALWFKASQFGETKDEVLIRANGLPTYFASDIAYHKNKFDRGFDWVINIWGADHHGHIARMKGALEALGYDPDKLTVIIMQLVRLYRNGEIARMSKRTGRAVTLADIVEEVGKDAARFFFNLRSADTHLDFDLDLAIKQSDDNPVYYVQYAHARISSILRQAKEQGVDIPNVNNLTQNDMNKYADLLIEESEIELIKKLADFPGEIKLAADNLAPYRITVYSQELASAFHSFYNKCRVLTDAQDLTTARLLLVMAVQQVIKNALAILGISAPDRM